MSASSSPSSTALPSELAELNQDYYRVARLIERLQDASSPQPGLTRLAEEAGMSPSQLQRLFSRWAGVSPKRFQQYLSARSLRARLRAGGSLLDITLDAQLSSVSRLHDHFVTLYGVTPDNDRNGGENLLITHGIQPSIFGRCHLGVSNRGICWLAFLPDEGDEPAQDRTTIHALQAEWPAARLQRDDQAITPYIARLFEASRARSPLYVHVKGSNFQLKVWEALLRIPAGQVISYGDLAEQIGHPRAARSVGSQIGKNPVAWLIPCHRVIRTSGIIGDYRWGSTRKQAMLLREHCLNQANA